MRRHLALVVALACTACAPQIGRSDDAPPTAEGVVAQPVRADIPSALETAENEPSPGEPTREAAASALAEPAPAAAAVQAPAQPSVAPAAAEPGAPSAQALAPVAGGANPGTDSSLAPQPGADAPAAAQVVEHTHTPEPVAPPAPDTLPQPRHPLCPVYAARTREQRGIVGASGRPEAFQCKAPAQARLVARPPSKLLMQAVIKSAGRDVPAQARPARRAKKTATQKPAQAKQSAQEHRASHQLAALRIPTANEQVLTEYVKRNLSLPARPPKSETAPGHQRAPVATPVASGVVALPESIRLVAFGDIINKGKQRPSLSDVARSSLSRRKGFIAQLGEAMNTVEAPVIVQEGDVRFTRAPVIGGEACQDHPATGAILLNETMHCTGTLIAADVVLTAAHCLCGFDATNLSFARGYLATATRAVAVRSAIAHEAYDPVTMENDIALLFLSERISEVAPADYARGSLDQVVPLRFVGYGYTSEAKDILGDRHCVNMLPQYTCGSTFYYAEPGKQTCNGDSGGPAFLAKGQRSTIVGLTSWGDASCTSFGVDTDVGYHARWITLKLQERR